MPDITKKTEPERPEGQTILQMQVIKKSFVGVEVLHGVDLDLRAGEVHASVGENGFVGREPVRRGIVDRRKMERETAKLLEEVGESSFSPRTPVRWLSVAQQQVVEIIKARSLNARILVLDEPTAALAEHEVEILFKLIRRLQELGVGILYISHRLREVFALADRITVIKDGGVVKTLDTASTNQRELVNLMVGRELDGYFPEKGVAADLGDVRLAVKGLTTPLLKDIN